MNTGESGAFNRTLYDSCAYSKYLTQSTEPIGHCMYVGKYENTQKCISDDKNNWQPFSPQIVDAESELRNIKRPYSTCDSQKYSEQCINNKTAVSTFDTANPIVLDQGLCPIIKNNIPKTTDVGYTLTINGDYKQRKQQ